MNERLSAMRCLFCNAEMVLMEAAQADPTTLPGFEHRTFLCPVAATLSGVWRCGLACYFRKLIADETEKWGKVVKFSGARPD
jgi:hypothetical protein